MRYFVLAVFLSSFLVFQVQPLIGRYILPWFGGTPAVWTACLLFFQTALLGGYAYAHFVVERFSLRRQVIIHAVALAVTLWWLPITPSESLKPTDASWPAARVLLVLLACVGGPFLIVSSTAPLLQSWFSRVFPDRSPYRLYALSNVGSLLGLFAYPFVVEPLLRLPAQTLAWSIGYGVFAALCVGTGWWASRQAAGERPEPESGRQKGTPEETPPTVMRGFDLLLWLTLSACGSVVLLSVTNQLCQNVAAVPFLWVLPLGLYLVTFILCFESDGWYRRGLFTLGWLAALGLGLWAALGADLSLVGHVSLYCFILFVCCMVCHGELARLKPEPRRLTLYFFLLSVGGALGGVFVSLVAPVVFDHYHEFYVGLFGSGLAMLLVLRRELWATLDGPELRRSVKATLLAGVVLALLVVSAAVVTRWAGLTGDLDTIARDRNFYGIVSVQRRASGDTGKTINAFTHGNTTHGFQFDAAERRAEPTGYYQPGSGVGVALCHHPKRLAGEPMRVGLIGLGVGTLAAYGNAGDFLEFYEIDPNVERFAREYFTYLSDAENRGAEVVVRLGDARIVLERQLTAEGPRRFDLLVLDAFSSDAVPVHLLTEECFALYRAHLAEGGVIAVHLSNRHLDLAPVIRGSAKAIEAEAIQIWHQTPPTDELPEEFILHSHWVLVSPEAGALASPELTRALTPWSDQDQAPIHWTDRYSSLFQVLR